MASHRKWGFDIDGVLADFDGAMRSYVVSHTGRNLFDHPATRVGPVLGWSALLRTLGYTQPEIDTVWASITHNMDFWHMMPSLPGVAELNHILPDLGHDDIYFITARKGAKSATEDWLFSHTGIFTPTVIRAKQKGLIAKAIGLDVFVDDRLDLALDVRLESPETHVYLLDRPYNAYDAIDGITRVKALSEVFQREVGALDIDPLEVVR